MDRAKRRRSSCSRSAVLRDGLAAWSRFSAGTLFTLRLDCRIAGHKAKLDLWRSTVRCRSSCRSGAVLAGACRRATGHAKSGMDICCASSRATSVQERPDTGCSLSRRPFVWEEATCERNLTGRLSGGDLRPRLASNPKRRSQPPCSTKPSQTQFFCCTSQLLPLSCSACLQSSSATGANWPGQTASGGARRTFWRSLLWLFKHGLGSTAASRCWSPGYASNPARPDTREVSLSTGFNGCFITRARCGSSHWRTQFSVLLLLGHGGATHPDQAKQGMATFNPCSNGAPTAGHQARGYSSAGFEPFMCSMSDC